MQNARNIFYVIRNTYMLYPIVIHEGRNTRNNILKANLSVCNIIARLTEEARRSLHCEHTPRDSSTRSVSSFMDSRLSVKYGQK